MLSRIDWLLINLINYCLIFAFMLIVLSKISSKAINAGLEDVLIPAQVDRSLQMMLWLPLMAICDGEARIRLMANVVKMMAWVNMVPCWFVSEN